MLKVAPCLQTSFDFVLVLRRSQGAHLQSSEQFFPQPFPVFERTLPPRDPVHVDVNLPRVVICTVFGIRCTGLGSKSFAPSWSNAARPKVGSFIIFFSCLLPCTFLPFEAASHLVSMFTLLGAHVCVIKIVVCLTDVGKHLSAHLLSILPSEPEPNPHCTNPLPK